MISFNEIIECLPPGKSYRRKRYNSFDANIGNEENLDPANPSEPCDNMKPDSKKVNGSRKCDDTDDEISFRDIKVKDGDHEDTKTKYKRKSNTEKFLEDNANYFQLEVLNSKTRSHKENDKEVDSDSESKDGFHTSFLDFLKSKGVSKESGRSRHKSADSETSRDKNENGRSRTSFKRYGRSRSSGRSLNGRERSLSRGRLRTKSITDADGSEVFISESESECSVRLPRLDLVKSRLRSASPSGASDSSVKSGRRNTRSKSTARDVSPTVSDVDISNRVRGRRSKSKSRTSRSSVRESTPVTELSRPRRRSRRDLSPVASDAESSTSTTSKSNKQNKDDSDEDDDDKDTDSPSKRRMQGRRSELDKLLEAVDTSFHFETAAAERKRLSETKLEPLEIDCSDTGSETSCKVASKRKINAVEKSPGRKKLKGSNNLLKTASPGSAQRSEVRDVMRSFKIFQFSNTMIFRMNKRMRKMIAYGMDGKNLMRTSIK